MASRRASGRVSFRGSFVLSLALAAAAAGMGRASPAAGVDRVGEAGAVMARSAQRYASCRTYRDRGVVTQELGLASKEKPFATVFAQERGLRYEFRSGKERFTIRSTPAGTSRWWSVDRQTRTASDPEEAFGEAAGISGGSSAIVPSLLLLPPPSSWFARMAGWRIRSHETLRGTECLVLHAEDRLHQPVQIWLGVSDHLLHRVTRQAAGSRTTIDYTAVTVDGPVAPAELR